MPSNNVEIPPFGSYPGRVRWSKRVGDVVTKGEPLLTIDFDYDQIVPLLAPCAGRLASMAVQDGAQISGGTVVGAVESVAQEVVRELAPIDICASYGVVRIARATQCARCGATHGSQELEQGRVAAAEAIEQSKGNRVVLLGMLTLFVVSDIAVAVWAIFFPDAR